MVSFLSIHCFALAANAIALKMSCELLRSFVAGLYLLSLISISKVQRVFVNSHCDNAEAVQRAAAIAEAEGLNKIEATHLERVLPQLLLDF